jgi:hypothetical protein
MAFQITALNHHRFTRLFELPDGELAENMAVRQTASRLRGHPNVTRSCFKGLRRNRPGRFRGTG